jgi:hypothetical protein
MRLQHLLAGAAAFGASVYSGFVYAAPMRQLSQHTGTSSDGSVCAFDRLASVYDQART